MTQVFDLYAAGDLRKAVSKFSTDIDWRVVGHEAFFPYANRRQGQTPVIELFEKLRRMHEVLVFEPTLILADGGHASVQTSMVMRSLETGNAAAFEVCSVLRLNAEQEIAQISEFLDSMSATMLLAGNFDPEDLAERIRGQSSEL